MQKRPRRSRPRVLTVDDEPDQRKLISIMLRDVCDITEAEDSHMALDLISTQKFDYVLTDSNLPEFDGFELCRHLRTTFGDEHAIIFVTASGDQDDVRERIVLAGANAIVTKPFYRNHLYSALWAMRHYYERRLAAERAAARTSRAHTLRMLATTQSSIAKRHSEEGDPDDPSHT